jgi:hypothetical protein
MGVRLAHVCLQEGDFGRAEEGGDRWSVSSLNFPGKRLFRRLLGQYWPQCDVWIKRPLKRLGRNNSSFLGCSKVGTILTWIALRWCPGLTASGKNTGASSSKVVVIFSTIGAVVHAQFSPRCKLYLPYLLSCPWSSNWLVKRLGTQNGATIHQTRTTKLVPGYTFL